MGSIDAAKWSVKRLIALRAKIGTKAVAKQFGVAESSVRRWLSKGKSGGIPRKVSGKSKKKKQAKKKVVKKPVRKPVKRKVAKKPVRKPGKKKKDYEKAYKELLKEHDKLLAQRRRGMPIQSLRTVIQLNGEEWLEFMTIRLKIGMSMKEIRDEWFSPEL